MNATYLQYAYLVSGALSRLIVGIVILPYMLKLVNIVDRDSIYKDTIVQLYFGMHKKNHHFFTNEEYNEIVK